MAPGSIFHSLLSTLCFAASCFLKMSLFLKKINLGFYYKPLIMNMEVRIAFRYSLNVDRWSAMNNAIEALLYILHGNRSFKRQKNVVIDSEIRLSDMGILHFRFSNFSSNFMEMLLI